MHLRTAVGCALVCALLGAEVGAAAPKAGSKSNQIKGKTSQGRPFRAVVGEHTVDIRRFVAELDCRDGTTLILFESGFLPSKLGKGGSVQDYQFGRTDRVWIRGRVAGEKFSGRLRVKDVLGKGKNRTRCDSGWFKFKAG